MKTATEVEALGLTFSTEQQLFGQVGRRAQAAAPVSYKDVLQTCTVPAHCICCTPLTCTDRG